MADGWTGPIVPIETAKFVEDVEESGVAKLRAYNDGFGNPTIGFGHTGPDIHMGTVITPAQADAYLQEDLTHSAMNVDRVVNVPLNRNQRTVLISFDFNDGDGALNGSTLLRLLNQGNYAAVPAQLARWVYATDKPTGKLVYSAGLANRRARESALWATPAPGVPAPTPAALVSPPTPEPMIPDAAPVPVPHDPDMQPQPPLTQSTTMWSSVSAFAASGGGMILAYVQSPYALIALGIVAVLAGYIMHERYKHRIQGGV